MNVLFFKRSWCLALIMFILPFPNVSFAETKTKTYDSKQLIRDVAILYRKHKLAEKAKIDQSEPTVAKTAQKVKKSKKVTVSKKTTKTSKKIQKTKNRASKLAKAKKRKARRIARARNILKARKKAKSSKIAKRQKNTNTFKRKMTVTATAYTSHVNQTDSTPNIAAWGDRLKPGMKVIAVSRDMLDVYGLKHRSKVRIKGLNGEYLVLDKMNKRWKKKIDIYMGKDLKKAFKWGRKKVELQWN